MIELTREIERLENEDLKPILRQMCAAINKLAEKRQETVQDILVDSDTKGIVLRRSGVGTSSGDGNYVRLQISGNGSSSVVLTDLGKNKPQR